MNQDSPGGTGADEEIASYQSGKGQEKSMQMFLNVSFNTKALTLNA